MSKKYLLGVGEVDRQRLTILNKIYNPPALAFLQENGLQPGQTVLEVGCGTGHMACDIAHFLGPTGKVIAIDNSAEQIALAKATAKELNITNIEFHVCDVFDISKLNTAYDATYGRWTIEFTQQPDKALAIMYQYLNKGGLLAYEASNIKQTAVFSIPYNPIIEHWHSLAPKMFTAHGCNINFANEIYNMFKILGCQNIQMRTSQAILTTAEQKSVYRLGLMSIKKTFLKNNFMSSHEIEALSNQLTNFEESDAISGFFQNFLIGGRK